jgi:hypothetical protein
MVAWLKAQIVIGQCGVSELHIQLIEVSLILVACWLNLSMILVFGGLNTSNRNRK